MTIGSLFAGIGGLELGLERAGLGPVVWQVEQDEFCRRVLAKHWPDADRSVTDVREARAENLERVDLICGGFPCQNVSSAGAREGLGGERSGLWFEFARVVRELRPAWVVVENVASGGRLWVDEVMAGLGVEGYESLPIPLSAADCGAPHLRRRVFIVGRLAPNSNGEQLRDEPERDEGRGNGVQGQGQAIAVNHGEEGALADAASVGRPRQEQPWSDMEHDRSEHSYGFSWEEAYPEPTVCSVDHGIPDRLARLKALGNAVVPQCAEVIGWVVRELQ